MKIVKMLGDGNCFPRCVAFHIYGYPELHHEIRARVVRFAEENRIKIDLTHGDPFKNQCWIEKMRQNGEWFYSCAILAAAWEYELPIIMYQHDPAGESEFVFFKEFNPGNHNENALKVLYTWVKPPTKFEFEFNPRNIPSRNHFVALEDNGNPSPQAISSFGGRFQATENLVPHKNRTKLNKSPTPHKSIGRFISIKKPRTLTNFDSGSQPAAKNPIVRFARAESNYLQRSTKKPDATESKQQPEYFALKRPPPPDFKLKPAYKKICSNKNRQVDPQDRKSDPSSKAKDKDQSPEYQKDKPTKLDRREDVNLWKTYDELKKISDTVIEVLQS
jgi:hypothetical protein